MSTRPSKDTANTFEIVTLAQILPQDVYGSADGDSDDETTSIVESQVDATPLQQPRRPSSASSSTPTPGAHDADDASGDANAVPRAKRFKMSSGEGVAVANASAGGGGIESEAEGAGGGEVGVKRKRAEGEIVRRVGGGGVGVVMRRKEEAGVKKRGGWRRIDMDALARVETLCRKQIAFTKLTQQLQSRSIPYLYLIQHCSRPLLPRELPIPEDRIAAARAPCLCVPE
ncbi:hypothetical protein HK102_012321, partial [Quaeritorhiza haematococci]